MRLTDWEKSQFSPDLVVFWLILNDASNIPQLLPQVLGQGLQKNSPVVPAQTKAKYKTHPEEIVRVKQKHHNVKVRFER